MPFRKRLRSLLVDLFCVNLHSQLDFLFKQLLKFHAWNGYAHHSYSR